jgi:exonuclease SbcC
LERKNLKISNIKIKDIKKYSDVNYDFTGGVQLILGPNGSGKSTIIEAVGWVLFDQLDYKLSEWVRWGQECGSVSIKLTDENEYIVYRDTDGNYTLSCGGSNIATGVKDVQRYIRKFFNISDDASKVFKDIIGVSQELMSAQFSMTPSYKKKIFDPLLGLDKYDKIWNQLKPIEITLEKDIENINVEKASIVGWLGAEKDIVTDFDKTKINYDKSIEETRALKDKFQELDKKLSEMIEMKKGHDRTIEINNEVKILKGRLNDIVKRKKTTDDMKIEKQSLEKNAREQKEVREKLSQIKEVEKTLSRLTKEHEKLSNEYESLKESIEYAEQQYKDNFDKLDRESKEFTTFENDFKKIESERVKLETQISEIEKQIIIAKEGRCPITGEHCPADILSTVVQKKSKADEFMETVFYKDYMDKKTKVSQSKNAVISLDNLLKMKDNSNRDLIRVANIVNSINGLVDEIDSCNTTIYSKNALENTDKLLGKSLERYNELCILVKNEDIETLKTQIEGDIDDLEEELIVEQRKSSSFVPDDFDKLKLEHGKTKTLFERSEKDNLDLQDSLNKIKVRLDIIKEKKSSLQNVLDKHAKMIKKSELVKATREKLREIPPEIAKSLLVAINETSNRYYNEIAGASTLMIDSDYNIFLSDHKGTRGFKSLSGGEKMTVSVAVRLAFLHEITNIKFMALDEPTASVDVDRRQLLSDIIANVRGLEQFFIISHDSVFIAQADNIIEVLP